MKKLLVLLTLSLLFVSCGKKVVFNFEIDPIFADYVEVFEKHNNTKVHLNVEFSHDLPKNVAGRCTYGVGVAINFDQWGILTEDEKSLLLFHELGHCVLGLKHPYESPTFKKDAYNCPLTIMSWWWPWGQEFCTEKNYDKYVKQILFALPKNKTFKTFDDLLLTL